MFKLMKALKIQDGDVRTQQSKNVFHSVYNTVSEKVCCWWLGKGIMFVCCGPKWPMYLPYVRLMRGCCRQEVLPDGNYVGNLFFCCQYPLAKPISFVLWGFDAISGLVKIEF